MKIIKLLMIGDCSVGKSSIVTRYTGEEFDSNYLFTLGVDFKFKKVKVNDEDYRIQLWDTAGQERFRSVTRAYYRGSHGVLAIFDITDRIAFENLTDWLKDIRKERGNDIRILIVGNKTDLEESRVISKEEGLRFAKAHGAKYIETSAKNKRNVRRAFDILIKDIYKKQKPKKDKNEKKDDTIKLSNISLKQKLRNNKCC